MAWLIVAVCSYILLAVTSLIDKILLSGPLSNPKLYAFYVGILSSFAFLVPLSALFAPGILISLGGDPYQVWSVPGWNLLLIGMASGAAQIYGSFFYLAALQRLEASRAVPIIGCLVPVFGFFLTAAVSGGTAVLGTRELAGFILLIAGGWLIMARGVSIKDGGLHYVLQASFLFALAVILSKLVYLEAPFVNGFPLMALGSVFAALTFLFSGTVRKTVFGHHSIDKNSRPNLLFFCGQIMGAAAFLLQSFSVSLAPQASVPVINAMAGVQYIFLFLFSMLASFFFPGKIKEATDTNSIIQKALAISLIMAGLAIFALN